MARYRVFAELGRRGNGLPSLPSFFLFFFVFKVLNAIFFFCADLRKTVASESVVKEKRYNAKKKMQLKINESTHLLGSPFLILKIKEFAIFSAAAAVVVVAAVAVVVVAVVAVVAVVVAAVVAAAVVAAAVVAAVVGTLMAERHAIAGHRLLLSFGQKQKKNEKKN